MGYFDKFHIFRDPVHGYVKVYELERDIINSQAFQRLKRIKQLGLTNMVYHGAEHTRFGHSLGVMEIANRIFEIVVSKDQSSGGDRLLSTRAKWRKDEYEKKKIILRLSALLHDIGHCPFSHGSEDLLNKRISHEDMSAMIIENNDEISQLLGVLKRDYDIYKTDVANIIRHKAGDPLLRQILDGPLDADKIDYLWRDSIFTGVYYGRFDADRLINTMVVVIDRIHNDVALGLELGGKYAAEALMLSRYYMFLQVYFHEIRRAYDIHLTAFLREILPSGHYPHRPDDFIKYDDFSIMDIIKRNTRYVSKRGDLAKIIRNRWHYVVLTESSDFTKEKEEIIFCGNAEKIKSKFPESNIFIDSAYDAPNKFKKDPFYLKLKAPMAGIKYNEIEQCSDVIRNLDDRIRKFRIYVPQSKLKRIKAFSDKLIWNP
jgi:HD superfamily phosphohydrolase